MLKLYNTLTRKKEEFQPIDDKKVGLYCCGPTVYWYPHIGNMRAYIFEDILRRALEYNSFAVTHIMNYTDVGHLTSNADEGEDKMEKGAEREGKTAWEIAEEYIKAFERDAQTLNILKPGQTPRATEHITEQIDFIKILEQKGFTYTIADGVYFDTSKLPKYGKLANLDLKGLKAGARIEVVSGKKNPTDFALWKFSPVDKIRNMEWDAPWAPPGKEKSKGFPGWHIECSAMSLKYLGFPFDIHCGGIDHLNVHHTNEVAQAEGAYGVMPANYWLHSEHIMINEGKMAKSEGNILTVSSLIEKGINPLAYRYLILTAHYRTKLNFTWESLQAAQNALDNLKAVIARSDDKGKTTKQSRPMTTDYAEQFKAAINDDLNTPEVLAIMWGLIKDEKISDAEKKAALLDFDKVLGLDLDKIKKAEIPPEIEKLAKERQEARDKKDWSRADELRQKIEKQGWQIEDTNKGPKLIKK